MTRQCRALAYLYTRHHELYVQLRLAFPWSPEHVVAYNVDYMWRMNVPPNRLHVSKEHPEPPGR